MAVNGANCIGMGTGQTADGANTICINTSTPIPNGNNIGFPFPVNIECTLGGVVIGPFNPLLVMNMPLPPFVEAGPCPICILTPFNDEINEMTGDEERSIQRSEINKFMQLKPFRYLLKKDTKSIYRGLASEEKSNIGLMVDQVDEVFPEIVEHLPECGAHYIRGDKLFALLVEQIQIHQDELDECCSKEEDQQQEIEILKKKVNELMEIVTSLQKK